MSENEFVVPYTVEFYPAVYIFLEKLASKTDSTISEVINKILREKALEELTSKPISWNFTDRSDLPIYFRKIGSKEEVTIDSPESGTIFCGSKD